MDQCRQSTKNQKTITIDSFILKDKDFWGCTQGHCGEHHIILLHNYCHCDSCLRAQTTPSFLGEQMNSRLEQTGEKLPTSQSSLWHLPLPNSFAVPICVGGSLVFPHCFCQSESLWLAPPYSHLRSQRLCSCSWSVFYFLLSPRKLIIVPVESHPSVPCSLAPCRGLYRICIKSMCPYCPFHSVQSFVINRCMMPTLSSRKNDFSYIIVL